MIRLTGACSLHKSPEQRAGSSDPRTPSSLVFKPYKIHQNTMESALNGDSEIQSTTICTFGLYQFQQISTTLQDFFG